MNGLLHVLAIALAAWAVLLQLNDRRTLHRLQRTVRDMLKFLNEEKP